MAVTKGIIIQSKRYEATVIVLMEHGILYFCGCTLPGCPIIIAEDQRIEIGSRPVACSLFQSLIVEVACARSIVVQTITRSIIGCGRALKVIGNASTRITNLLFVGHRSI